MLSEAKHLDLAKTTRFFASLRMTIEEKGRSAKRLSLAASVFFSKPEEAR